MLCYNNLIVKNLIFCIKKATLFRMAFTITLYTAYRLFISVKSLNGAPV